jgi:RNA polymerase sigma-70 factor (ECF subfamily)
VPFPEAARDRLSALNTTTARFIQRTCLNKPARSGVYYSTVSESRSSRSPAFDAEALDYLGTLRTISRRLVPDRSEADDLVQETYLHAFRASHRFQPGTNLGAWLRTILTNLVKNHRRDRGRSRVQADGAEVGRSVDFRASEQPSPEQLLLNTAMGERLQLALESMPKALRDAVWLRDVEELTYAEMAQRLRIPLGTVMSRISRGRRLLHERLLALDRRGSGQAAVRR